MSTSTDMAHATTPIVSLCGVTKRYGRTNAVNDMTLDLLPGRVYGLIGSNGAGKTTLMRLLAGLTWPTRGSISLFGVGGPGRRSQFSRLGVLIEEPGLNLTMTARQNLELHRRLRGIPGKDVIDELLDLVGLGSVGAKPAKDFSLGMRQRLGIAIALLPAPELLILDEPVNGLDPEGTVEMRRLFRRLNEERGITLLISSHNLPELHQTATDFIIVDHGSVVMTLSAEELEARTRRSMRIEALDPAALAAALEQRLGTTDFRVLPDGSVRLNAHLDEPEIVSKALADAGVYPRALVVEGESLESFFLSAIGAAR